MTWYAVHTLVAMRRVDKVGPISVWENVYLIEAENGHDAYVLGKEAAMPEPDDSLRINGVKATQSFAGIRKIINVSNPVHFDQDQDRPVSGTEITYSEFQFNSEDDLRKYAEGLPMQVYIGDDRPRNARDEAE